jgi:transposase
MLHAGLDLSRTKVDVCLLSGQGGQLAQLAVPPDADALRGLARRIEESYREPVCAVIDRERNSAFLVQDHFVDAHVRPTSRGLGVSRRHRVQGLISSS